MLEYNIMVASVNWAHKNQHSIGMDTHEKSQNSLLKILTP